MKRKRPLIIYFVGDFLTAMVTWTCLYLFRKLYIESLSWQESLNQLTQDTNFLLGIIFIPLFWVILYFITGFYKDIYRKSRLAEVWQSFLVILFGTIVIFFAFILDDIISSYHNYYASFLFLFFLQCFTTIGWRLTITTIAKHQLENRIVSFNTLMIGSNEKATELYQFLTQREKSLGYNFIGFIEVNGNGRNGLSEHLDKLGSLSDINAIIKKHNIEEVIIAIETSEHNKINEIINALSDTNVVIKIIPDIYDIIIGSVRVHNVFGAPLIEIYPDLMLTWQRTFKRLIDILVSLLVLLLLSPIYLFIALRVKLSSSGPIIYKQRRIGLHGRLFYIYKFRSMYEDAETNGPQLSSKNDSRITPWGNVMRKWRIDELPQFYNVLKGDMSLVGPRPERPYFVDKIATKAPHYKHLHKVKPGITSLGMVKFGYASTVEQMIERMKYDILYMENMSLALDFKVMLYTLLTIVQGKGR